MRTMLSLVMIALPLAAAPKPEAKPATVKELEVTLDLRGKGKATEPTPIRSADDLAKAIPDETTRAAVAKLVDFKAETLLLFVWSGSGQDKLTVEVGAGDQADSVIFTYARGLTRDLRSHRKLFKIT